MPNNVEFLKSCVKHSAFAQGGVDTNFIQVVGNCIALVPFHVHFLCLDHVLLGPCFDAAQKYFEDLFPRPITDSAVLSKAAVWATCGMVAEETAWRSGHFKHAGGECLNIPLASFFMGSWSSPLPTNQKFV